MGRKRGNGEGNIYQRKDGRWEARISLPGGKRKNYLAKTRQEASKLMAAGLRDLENGLAIVSDNRTVGQCLNDWLKTAEGSVRPSTLKSYRTWVLVHLIPSLGNIKLRRLSPEQVQRFYRQKLDEGLSPTSVSHIHAVLHKALEQGVRWRAIPLNITDLVDKPKVMVREMKVLSPDQAKALLVTAEGDRFEALYVLALATGMRQGELLGLRWDDIDLEDRRIQVQANLQRTKEGLVLISPKTSRSRRRVALGEVVIAALRRHQARQGAERLAAGSAWDDRNLVFCNTLGRPVEATNLLRRALKPLLNRAGLPPIRFHDLRHTAATLLLSKGVHPKVVSDMLGHSQIGITLNTYSHVLPDMQRDATAAMDSILGKRVEPVGVSVGVIAGEVCQEADNQLNTSGLQRAGTHLC